ncbi:MAG: DUF5343 domain-containing protein [Terriglobia bacterium]|jgi:hypothetical protein
MAEKHPYISGPGSLLKGIQQFRSSLPPKIDAAVLKKLGIAPKNESYLINILRFLDVIDEEGIPTPEARETFTQHDDAAFGKKFSEMIKKAYTDLFSLHGEKAWALEADALITHFRQSDQTSSVVGNRQATTFQTLAAIAGHGDLPSTRAPVTRRRKAIGTTADTRGGKKGKVSLRPPSSVSFSNRAKDLGLTVRIEISLPVAEDQATYDRIFKSIKGELAEWLNHSPPLNVSFVGQPGFPSFVDNPQRKCTRLILGTSTRSCHR